MSPDLLHVLEAIAGLLGTFLGHFIGKRYSRSNGAVREEVVRLIQMFRVLDQEKRQLTELIGFYQARCTHADCPNYTGKQSITGP